MSASGMRAHCAAGRHRAAGPIIPSHSSALAQPIRGAAHIIPRRPRGAERDTGEWARGRGSETMRCGRVPAGLVATWSVALPLHSPPPHVSFAHLPSTCLSTPDNVCVGLARLHGQPRAVDLSWSLGRRERRGWACRVPRHTRNSCRAAVPPVEAGVPLDAKGAALLIHHEGSRGTADLGLDHRGPGQPAPLARISGRGVRPVQTENGE